MGKKVVKKTQAIILPMLNIKHLELKVIGDSPLIVHKWSEKSKKQIRDKQAKKAAPKKEARNPEQEYLDAIYHVDGNGTHGLPAIAFKCAAVDACSHVEGVTKVLARGAFHVIGELVAIDHEGEPEMREDMVRIGMGTSDLRYRPEYKVWSITLNIRYNEYVLSPEQIINLFNTAGFAIGVGEWRPEKNGNFGMFHVATQGELS